MQCNTGLYIRIVTKTMLLWLLRMKNVSSHYIKNGQQNVSRKLAVKKENSCTRITFKKRRLRPQINSQTVLLR